MTAQKKLEELRKTLRSAFVEREEEIDLVLTAVIGRQHAFLGGPPGTAKTALLEAVCEATRLRFFDWLITSTTTPEEIFGPVDFQAMKKGSYQRITQDKLPQAEVAFLDEFWKAPPSVVNLTLKILCDRVFHNGTRREDVPLRACFIASNEVPDDGGLEAIYDRFLIRRWVNYVRDRGARKAIYTRADPRLQVKQTGIILTKDDIAQLEQAIMAIDFPDSAQEALLDVQEKLESEGVIASDRRWFQIRELIKAYAIVQGYDEVSEDLFVDVLPDCLWREPKERNRIAQIVGRIASPELAKSKELVDLAKTTVAELPAESADIGRAKMLTALGEANETLEGVIGDLKKLAGTVSGKKNREQRIQKAIAEVSELHKAVQQRAMRTALGRSGFATNGQQKAEEPPTQKGPGF